MRNRLLATALLWAGLLVFSAAAQQTSPTEPIIVQTGNGPVELALEVADEGDERARGLMFRNSLPERGGMLFDFGGEQPVYMWMRNTLISLDMLFIDGRGRVVHIARETTPLSEATITAGRPVRGVIEIAGGQAARLGIAVGDIVNYRAFAPER